MRPTAVISTQLNQYVSIHAPARGATPRPSSVSQLNQYVSITHPRGVRLAHRSRDKLRKRFNPRTRAGATPKLVITYVGIRFQSTHPRGVRRTPACPAIFRRLFQSTHPRGATWGGRLGRRNHRVSIHAPARGATRRRRSLRRGRAGFNPRTAAGCDPLTVTLKPWPIFVSIHAPARGATRPRSSTSSRRSVSIHARRAGCDTLSFREPDRC